MPMLSLALTSVSRPGARISTRGAESGCTSSCNDGGRSSIAPLRPLTPSRQRSPPPSAGTHRGTRAPSMVSGISVDPLARCTASSSAELCPSIESIVPRGMRTISPNGIVLRLAPEVAGKGGVHRHVADERPVDHAHRHRVAGAAPVGRVDRQVGIERTECDHRRVGGERQAHSCATNSRSRAAPRSRHAVPARVPSA